MDSLRKLYITYFNEIYIIIYSIKTSIEYDSNRFKLVYTFLGKNMKIRHFRCGLNTE